MYKTVRHGENSLQYKILAQQEEGEASVKRRRSPRSATAKLIAVIIFLIIGIIASAVLVPLILTNDFIALTGTFQKFSVSTLRRSHSGNHVVVIAKKPYGWNAPHSSVPPRMSNSSMTHSHDAKKSTLGTDSSSTTTEPTTKTITTTMKTTTKSVPTTSKQPKQMETRSTVWKNANEWVMKPSPTTSVVRQENNLQRKTAEEEISSTTSVSPWYKGLQTRWSSESSNNFIHGTESVGLDPMLLLVIIFILVVITMFFILKKTLIKRNTSAENETAESKEDKTRLLRPSDHEEE